MGFRTVVLLENDRSSEWENDAGLGKKIAHAANFASASASSRDGRDRAWFIGGRVLECVHADLQTLAVLESYGMNALAHSTASSRRKTSRSNCCAKRPRSSATRSRRSLRAEFAHEHEEKACTPSSLKSRS
jgi:hypothetical protein